MSGRGQEFACRRSWLRDRRAPESRPNRCTAANGKVCQLETWMAGAAARRDAGERTSHSQRACMVRAKAIAYDGFRPEYFISDVNRFLLGLQRVRYAMPAMPPQAPIEVLRRELSEAREQQAATAEILRVISSSPTGLQRVFPVVAASAARLCDAYDATIYQVDGEFL